MTAGPQLAAVDALAQLAFLVQGTLERIAGERDLSLVQTRLFGVLRDREPTMNEIAGLLGLDKSSVTGLVDRAARRGLVTRVPSTTDRRAVRVALTAAGRTLTEQVADRFADEIAAMLDTVPATERAALARTASRVVVAHAAERGIDLFATLDG